MINWDKKLNSKENSIAFSEVQRLYNLYVISELQKKRSKLVKDCNKETTPEYTIDDFSFDKYTRVVKFSICIKQSYRTIDRYITRNYVKYPVYSEWKNKVKYVNKTIKLNNEVLESLDKHTDDLICYFADDIIIRLNDKSLFPTWFQEKYIKLQAEDLILSLKHEILELSSSNSKENKILFDIINIKKKYIVDLTNKKNSLLKRINVCSKKIEILNSKKNTIFLSIITLGISKIYYSKNRKIRLENQKKMDEAFLKETLDLIDDSKRKIDENDSLILSNNQKYCIKVEKIRNDIKALEEKIKYSHFYVTPLKEVNVDKKFIPIRELLIVDYKKIIGCYIIWNKEKNKYYVGQSKDVIKRLKQHFNGSIPKNIIFAEDYYSAAIEKRDSLFYFKIIPLHDKGELDEVEKELIEEYDAFNSGYNGTSGNL